MIGYVMLALLAVGGTHGFVGNDSAGYSIWDDLACVGTTVRVLPFAVPAMDSCAAFCTSEPQCYVYNYGVVDATCILKKACTAFESVARSVVGVSLKSEWTGFVEGIHAPPMKQPNYDDMYGTFLSWMIGHHQLPYTNPPPPPKQPDMDDTYAAFLSWMSGQQQIPTTAPPPEPTPQPEDPDDCASPPDGYVCIEWHAGQGESTDPSPDVLLQPYSDILAGEKTFVTTYEDNQNYPTAQFVPPTLATESWADECVENAKGVGFLGEEKNRPNPECPAGWFLCKGMCYTISQRNSRGPERGPSYYDKDYMGVEARCGLCGKARVAFVGDDDLEMQRVAAEAARQTINEDKAVWVRRYRFLESPNPMVEDVYGSDELVYQPWHRFVVMQEDDEVGATYQRYYTGEMDDLTSPQWDAGYRNQEGSILCVNTIDRIAAAAQMPEESRLTFEGGCEGDDKDNMWDDHDHRWFPEDGWPFPGL